MGCVVRASYLSVASDRPIGSTSPESGNAFIALVAAKAGFVMSADSVSATWSTGGRVDRRSKSWRQARLGQHAPYVVLRGRLVDQRAAAPGGVPLALG
jgi:hypothetical protein